MDAFAGSFEVVVLLLMTFSIAALAVFSVWDVIEDRKALARPSVKQTRGQPGILGAVPSTSPASSNVAWVNSPKAA